MKFWSWSDQRYITPISMFKLLKNKCQTFLDIEPLLTGIDVAAAWGGCCCGCVGIVKDVVGLEGTVGYEVRIVY